MSSPRPQLTDAQDARLAQYRALSAPAVAGLILGLLSPLAMLDSLLWPVPILGMVFSGLGLWQIARRGPARIGRKAALAGLLLSLLFATAAPTNSLAYGRLVRREARQFALQWFELLAKGEPQKAFQLTLNPKYRQPFDDKLWEFYREGPRWREELEGYVSRPLVRTLLALGQRARASGESIRNGPAQLAIGQTHAVVRYYETTTQVHSGQREIVVQVYAVTYRDPSDDNRKTFFVGVTLERSELDTGRANWQLVRTDDGFRPPGL